MRNRLEKVFKSTTAFLCAVIWATALPLQMAFASIDAIPRRWWGSFDCSAHSRYLINIPSRQEGTYVNFRGMISGCGEVAASNPSSISFREAVKKYRENFTVRFENYSVYDSSTRRYYKQDGGVDFVANADVEDFCIRVLNGNGDGNYAQEDDVDTYTKYA